MLAIHLTVQIQIVLCGCVHYTMATAKSINALKSPCIRIKEFKQYELGTQVQGIDDTDKWTEEHVAFTPRKL